MIEHGNLTHSVFLSAFFVFGTTARSGDPRRDTYITEDGFDSRAAPFFKKWASGGLCEAYPFSRKTNRISQNATPIRGGSEGRSAFRNHAGVDEPLQKVVPELGVNPPPQEPRVVSWADSTQDKENAKRRTQSVPLRRGRWICDRPCSAPAEPASNAGRATEGPDSQDHEGGRPVRPALLCPPEPSNPAHDGFGPESQPFSLRKNKKYL